jgi:hypothetical protein
VTSSFFGHNFPEFIKYWSRDAFRKVGYGLGACIGALAVSAGFYDASVFVIPTVLGCLFNTA